MWEVKIFMQVVKVLSGGKNETLCGNLKKILLKFELYYSGFASVTKGYFYWYGYCDVSIRSL